MKNEKKQPNEPMQKKVVRAICIILALLMLSGVAYYAFIGLQLLFAS